MSLTVETGSIIAGANSYISVADADTYFTNRPHSQRWQQADDYQKEQALIAATSQLDELLAGIWKGAPVRPVGLTTNGQPRQWPRYDVPTPCRTTFYLSSEIPLFLKEAVCEQALPNLKGDVWEMAREKQRTQSASGQKGSKSFTPPVPLYAAILSPGALHKVAHAIHLGTARLVRAA